MIKFYPKLFKTRCSLIPCASALRHLSEDTQKSESTMVKKLREEMQRDKQALKWRKSSAASGDIDTKLNLINNQEQTSDFILAMQRPIELSPTKWLKAWEKRQEKKERFMQQFMPQRHDMLGPDLATAHFILHRGGAVKFVNGRQWMRADEDQQFKLPNSYVSTYKLEAIKCDNMTLYYEGVENIKWLQHLKFLSFHNVSTFDDWCLDRISGSQCNALEILDISGTKCTINGLSCLYRLTNLKMLIVNDPKESLQYELCCAMLEEALPNLKIVAAATIHDI